MPIVVASVACVVLVLISELARVAVTRLLPINRGARVVAALVGIVAAYLVVAALAFAFYRSEGVPTSNLEVVVDEVVQGLPAFGRIERNDRIIAIDGVPLTKSLSSLIDERNGAPVRLTVVRGGRTADITLQPIGHDGHWIVGFRPLFDYARSYDMTIAARRAIEYPIEQTKQLIPASVSNERADPGGPTHMLAGEYVAQPRKPRPEIQALGESLRFMTYVLLLIVLVDLVRVVRAVTAR
jgi:hypothetical protein